MRAQGTYKGNHGMKQPYILVPLVALVAALGASVQEPSAQTKKSPDPPKPLVTFIELGSVRCIPCRMMQPIMKSIEEKYSDQVKIVFHDVWTLQGPPYAVQYGIRLIPTQVFSEGDIVAPYVRPQVRRSPYQRTSFASRLGDAS
ncbi:MAG: thioredoxin family protein [Ignavibacteria bacterium]|nr:thioredoxin family protein [Ignavibacteria bacterium]